VASQGVFSPYLRLSVYLGPSSASRSQFHPRTRTASSGDVGPQLAQRLRAFVTSAAEKGAPDGITDRSGHKSIGMVRVYTRRSDAFADHAGAGLL